MFHYLRIILLFCFLNNVYGFIKLNKCYEKPTTSPITCKKYVEFEKVYTGDRIKCQGSIECPKTIVVMAKNVTKNTSFVFIPSETDEDLDFKFEASWCSDDAFEDSYVRVRSHVFNGADFLMLIIAAFFIAATGACVPNDDALFFCMMMNTSRRRRSNHGTW